MRYLVIPDVHERPDKLEHIRPLIKEADKVYFLGDWFDSFNMKSDTKGTIHLLNEFLSDEKVHSCIGNHDCQYLFTNPMFRCSGFRPHTVELVRKLVPTDIKRKFKLFHRVGDLVLSHAGYHPNYLPGDAKDGGTYSHPSEKEADDAVDMAFSGQYHRLFNPGEASGGRGVGGPTWLRWPADGQSSEFSMTVDRFKPLNFPQIVGHTPNYPDFTVRKRTSEGGVGSYCIDTAFRDVLWIDEDGKVLESVDLRAEGE